MSSTFKSCLKTYLFPIFSSYWQAIDVCDFCHIMTPYKQLHLLLLLLFILLQNDWLLCNSLPGYFATARRRTSECHSVASFGCWPTSDSSDTLSLRSLQDSLSPRRRARTCSRPLVGHFDCTSISYSLRNCVNCSPRLEQLSPKEATSFPDRQSYDYDQIGVSLCFFCVYYVSLFRFFELYWVVYCNGFILFIPTHNIVNFFINFTF